MKNNENIHVQIEAEADMVRRMAGPRRVISHVGFQALSDLAESAADALSRSIPSCFEHLGKTYFLRVSIGMSRLEIYDAENKPTPMLVAVHGAANEFGHQPPNEQPHEKNKQN